MNASQTQSYAAQWSELQLVNQQIAALQAGTATATYVTLSISAGPPTLVPINPAAGGAFYTGLLTLLQARQTALQNALTGAGITLA